MRILLLEDEPKLGLALKKALELQNYAVDLVSDGLTAYDFAVSEEYDMMIFDVMVPKLDGITLCQKLRRQHVKPPILLLTAKGQVKDKTTGLDAGADDYVVKPFAMQELLARIRALTRRVDTLQPPVLTVEGLEFHPATQQVFRNSMPIALSKRELAILEYLMRHAGSVVSKSQLLQHVWDFEADVLPGTVEVHVKHLRDKLSKAGAAEVITTIRGFGYMISTASH